MRHDPSNSIFQKAVAFVNQTNRHLFLTGKAGTGKTTFLKYIKEYSFKKMAVVAPTGVAAINAGGVTIHSFFQLPLGPFIPSESGLWGRYNGEINNRSSLLRNLRLTGSKKQVIRELDLLVIDEISMVRADLLDAVDTVLRHVRQQPLLAFGGVQMVYIGDLFQLPPVVQHQEWEILQEYYKSPFFFDAHALRHAPPLFIELKKIYRQKDDLFINLLNNIRNNRCTADDLKLLHQYYNPSFLPLNGEKYITLTSHNSKADAINHRELEKLPGKIYTYEAEISGEFYEKSFPAEKVLKLKKGAQIMFIRNDKGETRRFYNGKIGTITKIEQEKIFVSFPNEADELELEHETWENIRYDYSSEKDAITEEELGTFKQYPIRLAWAITIHKSQGLTFDKAIIDAGSSFAPGQVYVSLSRLTSLKGLVLHSRISQQCISTDNRVIEFVKNELPEDEMQQTLELEQKAFVRHLLLKNFDLQKVSDAVKSHLEEYEDRQIPDKEKCVKWAIELNNQAKNQLNVAQKFAKQLEALFLTCEEDGYKKLLERTAAATNFFVTELQTKILDSIKNHIEKVKGKKKVKRYVKDLQELMLSYERKKQQIKQALQLAEALHDAVDINKLLQLAGQSQKEPVEVTKESAAVKQANAEKGESSRPSL
jgi:GTPase SAR1 family protein